MTDLSPQKLAELIRSKRQVLEQLHQVGLRQGELVSSGDVGSLLKLLAAKQRLLAGLQAVEKHLEPFREQDPDGRPWASPQERAACADDAETCRTLLAAVVEMEREHEQAMITRRDKIAQQLERAHTAHDAHDAYRSHQSPIAAPVSTEYGANPSNTAGIDLTSEA